MHLYCHECPTSTVVTAVAVVTKKWNSLRTQFTKKVSKLRKTAKSRSGSEPTAKWRFFQQLHFL